MVFNNMLLNDPFFKTFFLTFPNKEARPPSDYYVVYGDKENVLGCRILYALAGFKQEDIKVYSEKGKLYIEADNNKEDRETTGTKFVCKFKHFFNLSDIADPDNIKVSFENGLLSVFVPIKEAEQKLRILHFGKSIS